MHFLYIEPHVIIFSNKYYVLFYDTLLYDHLLIKRECSNQKVLNRLIHGKTKFGINLSKRELQENSIINLKNSLRTKFMGDLLMVDEKLPTPVNFMPIANFQRSLDKINNYTFSYGDNVLTNLFELDIYLNNHCNINCDLCKYAYKQVRYCYKDPNPSGISIENLNMIFDNLKYSSINRINFLGGNIFDYEFLDSIYDLIDKNKNIAYIYLNIDHVPENLHKLKHFPRFAKLVLLISGIHDIKEIISCYELLQKMDYKTEISIIVKNEKELKYYAGFKNETIKMLPVFDSKNINFFVKNVFINKSDILNTPNNLRHLHGKKFLNYNFFGKLSILPGGDVFSSFYLNCLGNINKKSISEIITMEFKRKMAWNKTRSTFPCNECVFQYLCPSPSNYEFAIGKPNLCKVTS